MARHRGIPNPRRWIAIGLALVLALVPLLAGCGVLGGSQAASSGGDSARVKSTRQLTVSPSEVAAPPADATGNGAAGAGAASSASPQSPTPDRLVVSNASMAIEVKTVGTAVDAVRALAAAAGGEITNLSIDAGQQNGPEPQPLVDANGTPIARTPGSAVIVLRVPSEKLTQVENDAAKLGTVVSQSASETDVTQQHIDLSARLANLRAEEARLRDFLGKATKVSEMLEVERELSRVRGEIESMQAQLDYLERQAAMATLTLSLTSPGAVVRPNGTDWGFTQAITTGFQGAAALVRGLIVVVIALAPMIALVLVIVFVWRALLRRRRSKIQAPDESASDSDDVPPADVPTVVQ